MISISPIRLHWIRDDGVDTPNDLCAHSPIHFEIGGKTLMTVDDGDFTVSAAAIYLLRSLEADHVLDSNVHENLFPCCGHSMYDIGEADVQIVGCPNGTNFNVVHAGDIVELRSSDLGVFRLSSSEWKSAVKSFSDEVQNFYEASKPKEPSDEVASKGFAKMLAEWKRRRQNAE
jgi:hypothetical protein